MEISNQEALTILQTHHIEVAPEDTRSATEIAICYALNGSPVPTETTPLDSVARIQQEIAWQGR